MDMNFRRYPIGIQNFELLRNDNYVYVDKTPLVYKLANTNTTYFLSPPTFWKNSQTFLIVLRKVSHHDEKKYSSL